MKQQLEQVFEFNKLGGQDVSGKFMLHENSSSFKTVVNILQETCYRLSKDAGWHDNPREDGTMIALIHSEVSEAMEGLRKDLMDDHLPNRKMVEVELADSVIRICDLAGKLGLDLGGAIVDKLKYNLTRLDHKKENREKQGGKKF